MEFTMRDKVCQLIGKYQFLEKDFRSKSFFVKAGPFCGPCGQSEEAIKAKMCGQFLTDLNELLEEDESVAAREDPRKTASAGKWCADGPHGGAGNAPRDAQKSGKRDDDCQCFTHCSAPPLQRFPPPVPPCGPSAH